METLGLNGDEGAKTSNEADQSLARTLLTRECLFSNYDEYSHRLHVASG